MITEEQFAEACLKAGVRGHYHDGVWWQQSYPGFAKPMFKYRELAPGYAKPARRHALLGYSHHVPTGVEYNKAVPYMLLQGDALRGYGLSALPGKKRNQVRKGLRCCTFRVITDPAGHLEEIRRIYVSQTRRHTEEHEMPLTPASYYINHSEEWKSREIAYLSNPGREVIGAFVDEMLVGFTVTLHVEDTIVIEKVKCLTEAFCHNPVDALYHTLLERAGDNAACRRVINPGIRGGRLQRHKEQFLFQLTQMPMFDSTSPALRKSGIAMIKAIDMLRKGLRARKQ